MSKALTQILGGKNLTGVIQGVKSGIPRSMPQQFFTPNRTVTGDQATYTEVEGTRTTARIVQYGSPSQRRGLKGIKERSVKLIHTAEHQMHSPATLMNLRSYDSPERQRMGQQEIARQTREFAMNFENLRVAAVQSAFALGSIYFDDEGNLLGSSSSAQITVDYNIPSGNKTTLDVLGDGAIISAKWSAAGTAINTQLRNLKKAALKLTGYPIRHAFYGSAVPDYIFANTQLKEIINRNPGYQQQAYELGQVPNGLGGLQWHPADEAFFVDADGSYQTLFNQYSVTFCPEPSPDWYEFIEGTYPVPTSIGSMSPDAESALGNVAEVGGMFSYAKVIDDPATIKQVAGDTFVPAIKVPNAVFIGTVHW